MKCQSVFLFQTCGIVIFHLEFYFLWYNYVIEIRIFKGELMKLPLTFVISQTYESWSEEDIEIGDTDDKGFDFENEHFTMEETRRHVLNGSFFKATDSSENLSSNGDPDIETGVIVNRNIHCDKILDANGTEIDPSQKKKIWCKFIEQPMAKAPDPSPGYPG